MEFVESVTSAMGYRGTIPIGRATLGPTLWHVEIYHKAPDLHAYSRVEARTLLAVHGADRIEMIHIVRCIWSPGIEPPFYRYLPPNSPLIRRTIAEHLLAQQPAQQKICSRKSAWEKTWRAAFE